MTSLRHLRLAVAGAGALGLCAALRAAQAGAEVEVFDPSPLGGTASRVAAGMIAPLAEALFEETSDDRWAWFRAARDLWTTFADRAPGLTLAHGRSIFLYPDAQSLETAADQVARWNVAVAARSPRSLTTAEDWRIDPPAALAALSRALDAAGGRRHPVALALTDRARFDAVILAGGYDSRAFASVAPELTALQPIKGHILSFPGAQAEAGIVRSSDLYLVAQPGRLLVGATMQEGRDDLIIEPEEAKRLYHRAAALRPDLEGIAFDSGAGVRAATPDGLPMVGRSSAEGLLLATGARRNGWLYAPLVAEILLSYLSGGAGGPLAERMDPARFFPGPTR